jgi:hypothetical protein
MVLAGCDVKLIYCAFKDFEGEQWLVEGNFVAGLIDAYETCEEGISITQLLRDGKALK